MLIEEYIKHYNTILKKITAYCNNLPGIDVEDVMQEMYFVVSRPSKRSPVKDVIGLLVTMAKHTAYDMMDKNFSSRMLGSLNDLNDWDEVVEEEDTNIKRIDVARVANLLTDSRKSIILLVLDGWALNTLSEVLHLTWNNIRTLYYLATLDMRRMLC